MADGDAKPVLPPEEGSFKVGSVLCKDEAQFNAIWAAIPQAGGFISTDPDNSLNLRYAYARSRDEVVQNAIREASNVPPATT